MGLRQIRGNRDCAAALMGGDARGRLSFRGHDRGGLALLLPNDRFGLAHEGDLQHLVHAGHGADIESVLKLVGYLREILGIFVRDDHRLDARPQRRQELLLEPANGQDTAAERDFAGHGDVPLDRDSGH